MEEYVRRKKMKNLRQALIREIVENNIIETQDDLSSELIARNIRVTQATISRDIKELLLIKTPIGGGRYKYSLSTKEKNIITEDKLKRVIKDNVTDCDYSDNIVVIKTQPSTASSVAAVIDVAMWTEVVGTVAGDDNIIVIVKPKEVAKDIVARIKSYRDK